MVGIGRWWHGKVVGMVSNDNSDGDQPEFGPKTNGQNLRASIADWPLGMVPASRAGNYRHDGGDDDGDRVSGRSELAQQGDDWKTIKIMIAAGSDGDRRHDIRITTMVRTVAEDGLMAEIDSGA